LHIAIAHVAFATRLIALLGHPIHSLLLHTLSPIGRHFSLLPGKSDPPDSAEKRKQWNRKLTDVGINIGALLPFSKIKYRYT